MYSINLILLIYYSFKSMQQFGLGVTRVRDIIKEKQKHDEEGLGDFYVEPKKGVQIDIAF